VTNVHSPDGGELRVPEALGSKNAEALIEVFADAVGDRSELHAVTPAAVKLLKREKRFPFRRAERWGIVAPC
jgi:hypothetical protein